MNVFCQSKNTKSIDFTFLKRFIILDCQKEDEIMAVHNHEIAKILKNLSDLLEIDEASSFRVRAYRNAAQTINEMSKELSDLVQNGEDISQLPDIGKNMANKIKDLVKT